MTSLVSQPPRLYWLDITEGAAELDPLWRFLRAHVENLSAGRYEVVFGHSGVAGGGIRHPAAMTIQHAVTLAAANRVSAGVDALVLGCWGSPTEAVRGMVDCPVASLSEASVLMTRPLANAAAVVTVSPSLISPFAADARRVAGGHGLLEPPAFAYDPESTYQDVVAAIEQPAALIDRFDTMARQAVARGADAVITGCGYLGPVFAAHGYVSVSDAPDVPVLDCTRLAFEHVHALRALASAGHGPAGRAYRHPAPRSLDAMTAVMSRLQADVDVPARGR